MHRRRGRMRMRMRIKQWISVEPLLCIITSSTYALSFTNLSLTTDMLSALEKVLDEVFSIPIPWHPYVFLHSCHLRIPNLPLKKIKHCFRKLCTYNSLYYLVDTAQKRTCFFSLKQGSRQVY